MEIGPYQEWAMVTNLSDPHDSLLITTDIGIFGPHQETKLVLQVSQAHGIVALNHVAWAFH